MWGYSLLIRYINYKTSKLITIATLSFLFLSVGCFLIYRLTGSAPVKSLTANRDVRYEVVRLVLLFHL